jgi:hypothetical protein
VTVRAILLTGFTAVGVLLMGCYTLQPISGAMPATGTQVALDVNDAGRVALGGTMGPEIAQIQGRLIDKNDEDYLIAVSAIRLLRGGEHVWSGEQVRVKSEYVGSVYERRFSRERSIALGATVIGGFAAFLVTRSLIGSGSDEERPCCDTGQTRIVRP